MAARQASEEFAVQAFWYAWLRSVLDHLSLTDLSVGSFSAEAQQKAVREFSDGDRRHIETTSARVRRAYAEAIAHRYFFYSYGDCMFITRRVNP